MSRVSLHALIFFIGSDSLSLSFLCRFFAVFSLGFASFSWWRFEPAKPLDAAAKPRAVSISFLILLISFEFEVCLEEAPRKLSFLNDLASPEPNVL